jgi:hypothetical protein
MVTVQEILPEAVPEGAWRLADILQYPPKKKFAVVIALDDVPISLNHGSWRDIMSCDIPNISTYGWGVVGLCIQVTLANCVASRPAQAPNLELDILVNGTSIGHLALPTTPAGGQVQRIVWGKVSKPKELSLPLVIVVRGVPINGTDVIQILGKAALHVIVFPG